MLLEIHGLNGGQLLVFRQIVLLHVHGENIRHQTAEVDFGVLISQGEALPQGFPREQLFLLLAEKPLGCGFEIKLRNTKFQSIPKRGIYLEMGHFLLFLRGAAVCRFRLLVGFISLVSGIQHGAHFLVYGGSDWPRLISRCWMHTILCLTLLC